MRRVATVAAALVGLGAAVPAHAYMPVANRCVAAGTTRLFVKPTSLGSAMLQASDGSLLTAGAGGRVARTADATAQADWALRRRGHRYELRSLATRRWLAANGSRLVTSTKRRSLALRNAHGCKAFPEAGLDARGRTFSGVRRDGTLLGYADPHIHVTADLRAGGMVISGASFDRYGIAAALGHDADVHGPDGSLDVTGNLLRSGNPAGTHDTHGWPSFSGWPTADTYTHQQIYWRWLERAWMSGLRLINAMVVEDAPLCGIEPRRSHSCDETATIELEIRRLHGLQDYVDAQYGGRGRGWFRLVKSPRAARRVIERGKLAVVIGVESSNPFGCRETMGSPQCSRADIERGIALLHRLGVRSIFPAHWVDNALAGAALEGGAKGSFISAMQLSYTGLPFQTGGCPEPEQGEPGTFGGRSCNTRGLTDLGEYAIERLMDAHMLIEADHLSEWARERVLTLAERRHYPLLSSHTGTGGFWTDSDLRRLYALGGYATARLDDAGPLADKILSYRRYRSANRFLGVGLGSDTGGFNELPGPPGDTVERPLSYPFAAYRGHVTFGREQTGTRTFDLNRDGVAHYGLVPDLLAKMALEPHGREALGLLFHSAEAYVETWERAARSGAVTSRIVRATS